MALRSIVSGYNDRKQQSVGDKKVLEWMDKRVEEALDTTRDVGEEDSEIMVAIGKAHGKEILINK